jgi:glutamate/tyrosine decarboxylase-like PLP-dependent enzyme
MYQQLKSDQSDYPHILHETLLVAEKILKDQAATPPGRFIPSLRFASLNTKGTGAHGALKFFAENFADKIAASAGPRYFGFVTAGSTPASVAADWLVSVMDQNAAGSNDSIAPQIEHQTIDFMRQLFKLDPAFFGSFVTGATMSNFVGLAQARQWIGLQQNIDFSNDGTGSVPVKVLSGTPHSSIIKSLSMLGLGRNSLIKIPVRDGREAVDVEKLEQVLESLAHPVVVVANAGTVNTVDFDDLAAIAKLKTRYPFWLHVDAAFGGFAALSPKFENLLEGLSGADSITIDAHKWLNVPYDSAMQFTRHKNIQLQVFQNSAAYLGDPADSPDFFHYTPENSRRWRALPAWFTLLAYGSEGHCEIVERNCASAFYLGQKIESSDEFRLLAPVRMNVVCFSFTHNPTVEGVRNFLADVRDDGKVFFTPTMYNGVAGIRAAISNWQTEITDMDIAMAVIARIKKRQPAIA